MLSGTCFVLLRASITVALNRINEAMARAQPATAIGVLAPADAMAVVAPTAQPAVLKRRSIAAFVTTAFLKTPLGSSTFANVTAAS